MKLMCQQNSFDLYATVRLGCLSRPM